jgi:hypothetical protein
LGREADHSPPTTAEVKNTWIYISSPPYVFMACVDGNIININEYGARKFPHGDFRSANYTNPIDPLI